MLELFPNHHVIIQSQCHQVELLKLGISWTGVMDAFLQAIQLSHPS